jgi:hypothetical protein
MPPTQPDSWMLSASRRLARTSVSSTIPRAVSPSTESKPRRPNTSWARSRECNWARAESHSWSRTMHERKFYQTSFSRWSKLWSIHRERLELDQRLLYISRRSADSLSLLVSVTQIQLSRSMTLLRLILLPEKSPITSSSIPV